MAVLPLSQLPDWEVAEREKDIRGRRIVDGACRVLGTIEDLIVDTDAQRVEAVLTREGRVLPAAPLHIRDSDVVFRTAADTEASDDELRPCGAIVVAFHSGGRGTGVDAAGITAEQLHHATVIAEDGDIGKISDIYFDDQTWNVRYLVIDTAKWLFGRKVLVSPEALIPGGASEDSVRLNLTREQIRDSPPMDTDQPVSRQAQADLSAYYGWGFPMAAPGMGVGLPVVPPSSYVAGVPPPQIYEKERNDDPHLRSVEEIIGYGVHSPAGEMGRVQDFEMDADARVIRALIVDARSEGGADTHRIGVDRVRDIDWTDQKVRL